MAEQGKDYVLGKGKVYFDKFPTGTKLGTGERYLGNTPELSTSSDKTTLDHFDADAGVNVKDASVTIEDNVTGSLVTDHISLDNVSIFYGGEVDDQTIPSATAIAETHTAALGRWIQLGKTTARPQGTQKVTTVVVKIGSTTVLAPTNYEVNLDLGRIYIEDDAPGITDGATLAITYDQEATTQNVIVASGAEVSGALRFISANPIGPQKDYFWPYVTLTANGDFSLKGDEWQQIPFSFEVLKLNATTERVYITDRAT